MSTQVTMRLPAELVGELEKVARETGRTKTYYMKKALIEYLEDRQDYLTLVKALEKRGKSIPFDQIRRECGLLDD